MARFPSHRDLAGFDFTHTPLNEALVRQLHTLVWGEPTNARGEKKTSRIRNANGYSLTITGSLTVVEHLMTILPAGGAYTPSRLVGADLVTRLPGSGPLQIV